MKEALVYRRTAAKLTQEQVATVLCIDRSTISKWETGEAAPKTPMLPRLAALYKCDIADLFTIPKKEATP